LGLGNLSPSFPSGLKAPGLCSRNLEVTMKIMIRFLAFLLLAGFPFQNVRCRQINGWSSLQPALRVNGSMMNGKRKMRKQKTRLKSKDREQIGGSWGGQHISLVSADSGAAIDLDCAHAKIEQPLLLNRDNCFEAKGRFVKEHAGPQRPGEDLQSEPARFSGCVRHDVMKLTITLDGSGTSVGTFTLIQGRTPRITKCL
jgi:hypothetical protein